MARRGNRPILVTIAELPWPAGIVLGVLGFLLIRYGVPAFFSQSESNLGKALAKGLSDGPASLFAWLALVLCWLGAAMSYFRQRQRATLFDAHASNPRLHSLDWRQFEQLVGEWFRRNGYQVVESGGGGPDGGIDLRLRKDGRLELVQCKRWQRRQVDVSTVREMWGLLEHHRADAVWIVCTGRFTPDAQAFAAGKPIHLVTGAALEQLISNGSDQNDLETPMAADNPAPTDPARETPPCPRCGGAMVERQNKTTGKPFLGCTAFPACRGTLAIEGSRPAGVP